MWRVTPFIREDEIGGDSPVDGGERGVVVVDRAGSCVVAGEP